MRRTIEQIQAAAVQKGAKASITIIDNSDDYDLVLFVALTLW
jgi:hypothetical protein